MSPARIRLLGALLIVMVACALAFSEIDRLIGELGSGRLHISDVIGIAALGHINEWSEWQNANLLSLTPSPFILLHLGIDVLYMGVYGLVIWYLVVAATEAKSPERSRLFGLLIALIVVDVLEDLALLTIAIGIESHADWLGQLTIVQALLSTAKWAVTIVLLVVFARTPGVATSVGELVRRCGRALYVQRLVAFVVLVLAALSLVAVDPLLEQVPDIQRSWLDEGNSWHGFWAALVLVVLAVTFFLIGRKRAEMYQQIWVEGKGAEKNARTYPTPKNTPLRRPAQWHYLIWILIPATVAVVGAIASRQAADVFDLDPFLAFLGVFALLLLSSGVLELVFWLRWRRGIALGKKVKPVSTKRKNGQSDVLDVATVGDVLCALIIALPALGFARSLATEVILEATDARFPATNSLTSDFALLERVALIVLSLAIAVSVVWIALRLAIRPTTPLPKAQPLRALDPRVTTFGGTLSWIVIGFAATLVFTFLFFVGVYPAATGERLGAIAITVGSLGAWTTLIGLLTLVLRRRRPLALFEFIGLRSDPLIVLFLVVPIVVAQFASTPELHAVDQSAESSPERDQLPDAFGAWLDRSDGCTVDIPGKVEPQTIRPLVLVAAEGGGIRAAVWTTAALSQLVEAGSCASNSVFLSSGVSGGSVGLAIAANPDWDPDDLVGATAEEATAMAESMRNDVLELSNSTALATAMSGFLITDPIAATTGIRLPNAESTGEWRDRASLIENSWRDADERLDSQFDSQVSAPTGAVILNSTDIGSGCRAIISQIELAPGQLGTTIPGTVFDDLDDAVGEGIVPRHVAECDYGLSEPPLTLDVLDYFECMQEEAEALKACRDKCPQADMDWATASLLSARFPYVTPSASLGGEGGTCYVPRLQLVDGGYAENSGLGLLADTAPRIALLVRDYNTNVREADEPLIVPYVLYLQNSPASLPGYSSSAPVAELVVPLAGSQAKKSEVSPTSWIQRTLLSYLSLCNPGERSETVDSRATECANDSRQIAVAELNENRRAIVMSMDNSPSIALPLGWGLSRSSFDQMVNAAALAASPNRGDAAFLPTRSLGSFLHLYVDARDPVVDTAKN